MSPVPTRGILIQSSSRRVWVGTRGLYPLPRASSVPTLRDALPAAVRVRGACTPFRECRLYRPRGTLVSVQHLQLRERVGPVPLSAVSSVPTRGALIQNDTKAIHRTVGRDGLILGPRGKQQTSLCLHHNVDSEDGSVEHEPPRRMDNEMTYEMVQEQEEMIRLLHFQQNDTKAIHRTVGRDGLILGPRGKQQTQGDHGKGLGEGVLAGVIRMFHKAAFAPTEEAKQDLFNLLAPGSHMYTYMAESVFGPKWVHRWAKHGQPGLPTVGITSTQRVESTNSALKPAMTRPGTMVDVHRAISKKSHTGGPVQRVRIPTQSVWEVTTTGWLHHFAFVQDGMRQAECSAFSMKGMSDEALAAMGYTAKTLATGNNDAQRLMADFVANPAGAGLLYGTGEGGDVTLTIRTSTEFFAELLREQVVDRLVCVTNMYGLQPQYCHLVALGPDGFFLCTCLRILTDGLGCRHALRAMKDGDLGFTGASIANRWRDSTEEWTMARLAAKPAVAATAGGGVPGELPAAPADPSVFTHSKATVRASGWASCCAFEKELASITAGIDNILGISRVLENLKNHARLMVEVELRSQHDTSTSRVFKGVVTSPTIATEAPEETRPDGRSGRGKSGGAGREGANGRGRRGAAGRGGRGGAGAVVSAAGVPSPGGGLPTLQQAAGASATSGGGGRGGAGVSAVGMQSPGVGLPASTISGGGGASPFQPLSNAPRAGGGGSSTPEQRTLCRGGAGFPRSRVRGIRQGKLLCARGFLAITTEWRNVAQRKPPPGPVFSAPRLRFPPPSTTSPGPEADKVVQEENLHETAGRPWGRTARNPRRCRGRVAEASRCRTLTTGASGGSE
eukprot:jgi/Undpi1/14079/HiC_scaffold_9.g03730.m1